jgi:hypothetical protein
MGNLGEPFRNVKDVLPPVLSLLSLQEDEGTGGSGPHGVTFDQFTEGVGIRYYQSAEGEDADVTEASAGTYD